MPTCDGSCARDNWQCHFCKQATILARERAVQARVSHQMGLCGGKRRGCHFCAASRRK